MVHPKPTPSYEPGDYNIVRLALIIHRHNKQGALFSIADPAMPGVSRLLEDDVTCF